MTRHYCDICNSEIYVPNKNKVLISPGVVQEYDLCSDCKKAINEAKNKAEIDAVKELGRKSHE